MTLASRVAPVPPAEHDAFVQFLARETEPKVLAAWQKLEQTPKWQSADARARQNMMKRVNLRVVQSQAQRVLQKWHVQHHRRRDGGARAAPNRERKRAPSPPVADRAYHTMTATQLRHTPCYKGLPRHLRVDGRTKSRMMKDTLLAVMLSYQGRIPACAHPTGPAQGRRGKPVKGPAVLRGIPVQGPAVPATVPKARGRPVQGALAEALRDVAGYKPQSHAGDSQSIVDAMPDFDRVPRRSVQTWKAMDDDTYHATLDALQGKLQIMAAMYFVKVLQGILDAMKVRFLDATAFAFADPEEFLEVLLEGEVHEPLLRATAQEVERGVEASGLAAAYPRNAAQLPDHVAGALFDTIHQYNDVDVPPPASLRVVLEDFMRGGRSGHSGAARQERKGDVDDDAAVMARTGFIPGLVSEDLGEDLDGKEAPNELNDPRLALAAVAASLKQTKLHTRVFLKEMEIDWGDAVRMPPAQLHGAFQYWQRVVAPVTANAVDARRRKKKERRRKGESLMRHLRRLRGKPRRPKRVLKRLVRGG